MLVALAAHAEPPPPEAYVEAARLVEVLFLEPDLVDPQRMLREAARELERDVPWLLEDELMGEVVIRHGDGTELGRVSASTLADLPAALARLERLVVDGAHPAGDLDVRLSVLEGASYALDRYSRVLADERLDRFNVRLTGTLVGIGATFDRGADERMVVVHTTDGAPAQEAGLLVGDHVQRIDGRSTAGMPLSEATRRVRGEAGTQVALLVERDGRELTIALTRAEVVVPNVVSEVLEGGIGYVAIDHVSQRTVENLAKELASLRAAGALGRGLVVDLRGNTGGSMKESANVADVFLEEGLLLRTVGKDGGPVKDLHAEMRATDNGTEPEVGLVLLVDERTASGSEILAGALLELDRAALVGTRTYGKGTVQKSYPLTDDVRLKLTVARYILANDRRIADTGIVPDVSIGTVSLDAGNVRYTGWDEAFQRVPWTDIVPEVVTGDGDADLPLEIARRALLAADGISRHALVDEVKRQAAAARAEQEARLAEALTARGLDWSPAPEEGTFVEARATVRAEPDGDAVRLVATVENLGLDPLYQALVQVDCTSASWWDDVVVPVGRVPAGEAATGAVTVPLPTGIDSRIDAVEVRLRTDGRPPLLAGEQTLESSSSQPPVLRVAARLVGVEGQRGAHDAPVARAEFTVQNLSRTALTGLEVHLGYPGTDAIELVDWAARVPQVPGRSERQVALSMEVGPDAPAELPLELVVQADGHGELVDWPLALPRDGSPVLLQAPQIDSRPPVRKAPPGPFTLPVSVVDDRAVAHVVVVVNGDKVRWAPGAGARVDLAPTFELLPGTNRITVEARDDQGLVAVRTVTVRGEGPPAAVDAGE